MRLAGACGGCGGSKFGLTWDGVARCSKHDRSSAFSSVRRATCGCGCIPPLALPVLISQGFQY